MSSVMYVPVVFCCHIMITATMFLTGGALGSGGEGCGGGRVQQQHSPCCCKLGVSTCRMHKPTGTSGGWSSHVMGPWLLPILLPALVRVAPCNPSTLCFACASSHSSPFALLVPMHHHACHTTQLGMWWLPTVCLQCMSSCASCMHVRGCCRALRRRPSATYLLVAGPSPHRLLLVTGG